MGRGANIMTYKPLPKTLTIKESDIDGLGLFTTTKIPKGVDLGVTHLFDERFENDYIRTPLGGFINHSDEPNVQLIVVRDTLRLSTTRVINPEEEIKLKYHLYEIV